MNLSTMTCADLAASTAASWGTLRLNPVSPLGGIDATTLTVFMTLDEIRFETGETMNAYVDPDTFPVGTDFTIKLVGLRDAEGAVVADAVVSADIYDRSNTKITPSTLMFTAAGEGDYSAVVPASTPLKDGATYALRITAISAGNQMQIDITRKADFISA